MKAIQAVSPILFHHPDEPISKSIRRQLKDSDEWTSPKFLAFLKEIAKFESVAILRLLPFIPEDFSRSDYLEMVKTLGSVEGKILGPIRAAFLVRVFDEWLPAEAKKTPLVYISHDDLDENVKQALQANGVEVVKVKDAKEEANHLMVKEESVGTFIKGIKDDESYASIVAKNANLIAKDNKMANEVVKESTIVVPHLIFVRDIVGMRADKIHNLERYSGAQITWDKSNRSGNHEVVVKGTPEQVEIASSIIKDLCQQNHQPEPFKVIDADLYDGLSAAGIKVYVNKSTITVSHVQFLVPKSIEISTAVAETLRNIERQSSAEVFVRNSKYPNIRTIFVEGTLEQVRQACAMIYKVISQQRKPSNLVIKPSNSIIKPPGLVIKPPKSAINPSDLEDIMKKFPTFLEDLQDIICSQTSINVYLGQTPFFMFILEKLFRLVAPTELLVMISELFVKKGVDLSLKDGLGLTAFDRVEEFLMACNDNSLLADQLLIILLPK